ncbi:MAG: hypothetical protein RIR51_1931 [Bacteroidota bacterium]
MVDEFKLLDLHIKLNITKVEEREREELFSKRIRAGKRTYFFDVKSTRSQDYYITITESRRHQKDDGFVYEKHKMFLYKEDFDKFVAGLQEAVNHVKTELLPDVDFSQFERDEDEFGGSDLKWE